MILYMWVLWWDTGIFWGGVKLILHILWGRSYMKTTPVEKSEKEFGTTDMAKVANVRVDKTQKSK